MNEELAVSARLETYVRSGFPPEEADEVLLQLLGLGDSLGRPSSERVLAAVTLVADGDFERFTQALELARIDWRDVLVQAGLENEDWPDQLNERLGPG